MGEAARNLEYYSYAEYATWDDDERYEIIDGVPILMSPAPGRKHQRISLQLAKTIANFIDENHLTCLVYAAPFDVRLPEKNETANTASNVVQPDISVFCNPDNLDDHGGTGAPEIIFEILSPSTARKDQTIKLALYERHGVKELWYIHPEDKLAFVRYLGNGEYGKMLIFTEEDTVELRELPGCSINLNEVFGGLD